MISLGILVMMIFFFFNRKMMMVIFLKNEPWANALNIQQDAWFLKFSMIHIYIYIYIYIYLKTETCANAPSLEHKSMSLKKKWFDIYIYIWKQWCKWWFLKTSGLGTSECHNLIKKNLFECQTILKNYTRT